MTSLQSYLHLDSRQFCKVGVKSVTNLMFHLLGIEESQNSCIKLVDVVFISFSLVEWQNSLISSAHGLCGGASEYLTAVQILSLIFLCQVSFNFIGR